MRFLSIPWSSSLCPLSVSSAGEHEREMHITSNFPSGQVKKFVEMSRIQVNIGISFWKPHT